MRRNGKIDYIEFPAVDMQSTKSFYSETFGWDFVDHGQEYASFSKAGVEGGFYQSEQSANTENGSVLIVLYSENLEDTLGKVKKAGGVIVQPIFTFPGGRRFHFLDPNGNELAVWSDFVD